MGTRNISWKVKAARAYGLKPYHLHVPIVSQSGNFKLLVPCSPLIGLYRDWFTFMSPKTPHMYSPLIYHLPSYSKECNMSIVGLLKVEVILHCKTIHQVKVIRHFKSDDDI